MDQMFPNLSDVSNSTPVVTWGGFPIFPAVLKALPPATRIISATPYVERSPWFSIGRIEAKDSSGKDVRFFVKYSSGTLGRDLLRAEYLSQSKLYYLIPDNVPRPFTWGDLELGTPNIRTYLITEFISFLNLPLQDPEAVGKVVSKLHNKAVGTSHRFGAEGRRFDGLLCYLDGWEENWAILFARMLYQVYHYNTLSNGPSDELHSSIIRIIRYVIPRLLNIVRQDGQSIKPVFIHGDLWEGHIGTTNKGQIYLFDSSGYYAHHEMEFALWKTRHHRMHERDYIGAYAKNHPPSEPRDEFDDRVLLYTLKSSLVYSAMCMGKGTREQALENMEYLLERYHSSGSLEDPVDSPFMEISNGEQLWVSEYPPEVAKFIEARKNEKS